VLTRSRVSGPTRLYVLVIRCVQNSIPLSVSKSTSVRSDMWQFIWPCTVSWLLALDYALHDVTACNSLPSELHLLARPLLYGASQLLLTAVVGFTGLSPHKLITISLAACNRDTCSGISSTRRTAGSNKQSAERIGLNLLLFTSVISWKRL